MRATVVKRTGFDAAHYLPNYPGKCRNMHGHHWVIELGVQGEIGAIEGQEGMVIDFSILGGLLGTLKNNLDHTCLNDTIPNPTAENICKYVKDWIGGSFEDTGISIEFIRVWESDDSYAEVKG